MSMLRPKGGDDMFQADKSAQELQAHKRNWRPWIVGGVFVLALLTLITFEPRLHFWKGDDEPKAKEIQPAFNIAGLTEFEHPDPPVVTQRVEVPRLINAPSSVPKPPPVPEPEIKIDRVRLDGTIAYIPQGDQTAAVMFNGARPVEAWGCAIRPGNVIQATFMEDVRWDYGGPVMANVTEDVFSLEGLARGQRIVLIPDGATLFGTADASTLMRGMDLAAGPIWTSVEFIDTMGMPRSINLFDAQGAGASGINAIGGDVDPRWWPIIGAATFFTVLDVLGSINVNLGDSDTVDVRVSGDSAASIGREVVKSMLDWKPRILTRKGTQILVKPTKAIRVC